MAVDGGGSASTGSRRSIGRTDRGRPLPLSAGQQQMWFLHRFDPASPAYLMSWVLRVCGGLDVEGLRWAWERVVARHEILRTRYAGDEEPVQLIDPPGRFEVRVVDLTGEPAAGRERRARRIAEWERRKPFDLTAEYPVRVTVLVLGPDLHLVVVSIHHIACDGTSYPRLAAELDAYYTEHAGGAPAGLAEVGVQYADYAAWELAGRSGGALRPHLDYWRGALAGAGGAPLPTDRPRPARPNWRGGAVDVAVKPETAEGLRALATAHRASPYMVMLAAYHAALGHICGTTDQAVGIPVSGRTVPDLDGMVGYLVNTVVVRSRQRATDTFGDLVTHVRAQVLDAFGHRAVPFKWVVDELNPSRASTANPLFQAAFDMDPTDEGAFRLAGLRVEQLGLADCPAAKFDLTLHVEDAPDKRLFARLEYATAVIDEATAQAWAAYCEALFEELVRAPQEPLTGIRERLVGQGHLPARSAPVPVGAGDAGTPTGTVPRRLLDRIHQVWREVLAVEDVDVSDNFFDVGGDSLRAVALAGRLREDGLDVSAADVFAHQTVEELAHACAAQPVASPDSAAWPGPVAPFAMLSPQDRAALPPGLVDAYPLAAMQLGMLIEMRARPGVHTYQDSTSYRIRDGARLDPAALQRAAQLVVDRHEVLRTTFDLNGYSVPLQLVHGSAAIVVGLTDHGTLGAAGWQPRLEEHAARERRELMDLASAPLIRVHAHTAEDSAEWWITLTECHPIIEGWSFHTMLMEILTGYREIRAGRVPPEPEPVRFRYADYIVAETAARQSAEHRAYWRGVVEGRVDVSLPSAWQDSPDTPRDRYQHLVDFRDLDAELHRLATETRTSMKAVLLAAHLKVMSMVFGSDGFFTGLVCDARPEVAGADRVLGMYLNTVPFPMPSGARTWGELIRAVYDDLTEMWPHRVFPMQAVQHESGAGRLLDVFFNYLDFHQVDSELVDEDRTYNDNENEFALHVFTFPGILKFNTTNHRLSRAAADRLAGLYRTVLVEMCTGPDGDAGSACLPAAERARLDALGTGSATGPEPVSIVDAFADAVRRYPDEPAVRCGDRSLTYRQLDARSAAVARQLRSCGAGPGQLVAVAPHRNENTVAALLGTWLAGAAWTLVEPAAVAAQPAAYAAVITPADPAVVTGAIPVAAARMSPARPGPQDVACVVSGAVFTHRALAWAVRAARAGLDARGVAVDPGHTWLGTAPLASAAALCDLLVPLTGGGVAVLSTRELPEAVAEVAGLLAAGAVTHVRTTAPVAAALPSGSHATIIIGGGEVDALPGVGVRVVDAGLRPVATGVVGELCVTGPALAEGYHADPAGTAARFVPDPAGLPGSRLHRTGLLARFAADGTLEQLGPVDQHAWVDGHRDEWYRTREALDAQPGVLDSCLVRRADPGSGRYRLIGYARTAPDAPFDPDGARRALAGAALPRHLVPDLLVPLAGWPLTASGAIDPDRLPDPPAPAEAPAPAGAPLWDEQFETLLREALAAASYQGELTPDVSLTDAGLDSFGTVGLLVSLEQGYGITIPEDFPVVDIFRTPRSLWETVASLRDAA